MIILIFKDQEKQQDDLLSDVADFFWNTGHEVDIADNSPTCFEDKNYFNDYDCCVSVIYNDDPGQSIFKIHEIAKKKYFDLYKIKHISNVLIFSNTGVYTDLIPYPHKIFNYKNLDKRSLELFFQWYRKLNLFIKT